MKQEVSRTDNEIKSSRSSGYFFFNSVPVKVLSGLVFLLAAIGIYFAFRSETIYLNKWAVEAGLGNFLQYLRNAVAGWHVSGFVKYSLPDGLFCVSYILLMDAIWWRSNQNVRIFLTTFIPLVAVIHEIMQGMGIARGTFDWLDLLAYAVPLVIYISLLKLGSLKNFQVSRFWSYRKQMEKSI